MTGTYALLDPAQVSFPKIWRESHSAAGVYGRQLVRVWLLSLQGGKCALCGSDFPQGFHGYARKPARLSAAWWQSWCLDHDHATDRIRDVLCRGCNALLGKVENGRGLKNPKYKLAVAYIARHKSFAVLPGQ